jgi:hypothetical protein
VRAGSEGTLRYRSGDGGLREEAAVGLAGKYRTQQRRAGDTAAVRAVIVGATDALHRGRGGSGGDRGQRGTFIR